MSELPKIVFTNEDMKTVNVINELFTKEEKAEVRAKIRQFSKLLPDVFIYQEISCPDPDSPKYWWFQFKCKDGCEE